jgi:hypothetical protein
MKVFRILDGAVQAVIGLDNVKLKQETPVLGIVGLL